jgi:hypothetical protein
VQEVFSIVPLNWEEWKVVLYLSAPILVLEEVFKLISVRIDTPLPWSCDLRFLSGHFCRTPYSQAESRLVTYDRTRTPRRLAVRRIYSLAHDINAV